MQLNYGNLKSHIAARRLFFIVAACARSGTMYISHVFQKAGIDVGHWMQIGEHGIASDLVAPFVCLKDARVIHQVRDPIDQISSMQTASPGTWEYIRQIIQYDEGDSLVLRCMKYWNRWNALAEVFGLLTYRLEDVDQVWPEILRKLGMSYIPMPEVSNSTNTRKSSYESVTWEAVDDADIDLSRAIARQAYRYGYRSEQILARC